MVNRIFQGKHNQSFTLTVVLSLILSQDSKKCIEMKANYLKFFL